MAETFRVDLEKIFDGIEGMQNKAKTAIRMYAQESAKTVESYAKANRRWTDRTGHARQRLTGYVEEQQDKVIIYVSHGVNYGIYLELAHEKKYAILQESINKNAQEILEGFKGMIDKMG